MLFEDLSPEQLTELSEFAEKWLRIGLATGPADRLKAEEGIRRIYQAAGILPPLVVWCSSPLAIGLTQAIVQRISSTNGPDWDSFRKNKELVIANIERSIEPARKAVGDNIWHKIKSGVRASVWHSLQHVLETDKLWQEEDYFKGTGYGFSSAWTYHMDTLGEKIRESIGDNVKHLVRDNIFDSINLKVNEPTKAIIYQRLINPNGYHNYSHPNPDFNRIRGIPAALTQVRNYLENAIEANVRITKADINRDTIYEFRSGGPDGFDSREAVGRKGELGENLEDSIGAAVLPSIRDSGYGQLDAERLWNFDYLRSVLGLVKETDALEGHFEIAKTAGWYLPHKHICWISERPTILCINKQNHLHSEDSPAVVYPDGWYIYALNGVRMPDEYVMQPAEQMDLQVILRERNVDIRRELLRKVGVSRMLKYGKEIDRQGSYRLIDMSRIFKGFEVRYAPYLLMESPSVDGSQHLEGVSPECRTVEQAINWRASEVAKNWNPDLLS
jgi:hypothetical protein